jgi:hypothetical protein
MPKSNQKNGRTKCSGCYVNKSSIRDRNNYTSRCYDFTLEFFNRIRNIGPSKYICILVQICNRF